MTAAAQVLTSGATGRIEAGGAYDAIVAEIEVKRRADDDGDRSRRAAARSMQSS